MNLQVIYEPGPAAAEYAPLACNLFTGCGFGCRYCYARKMAKRWGRLADFDDPRPRPEILQKLEKDCQKLAGVGDDREVLFCFTCDPYQKWRMAEVTRRALTLMKDYGLRATVLTKAGFEACRDLDILRAGGFSFGASIVWADDKKRQEWEPCSASVNDRRLAIIEAAGRGIRTWVSLEPVIDPDEALRVVEMLGDYVDHWKVGKISHEPELEKRVDWAEFHEKIVGRLEAARGSYYIKKSLAKYGDGK